ncbi:MAG: hypothetical protein PHI27_11675 [Eubacteriales bacterium]|nr:hypothetical protein [Eubacteriales bacterium]MDD3880764.1 hypothetical protein [Eubacteriales bacterium]MDD3882889.1 hypothetical protein [Eubacteriales bacterium]MDD4511603.1 hypothetical protein [Eubacteriales bacterium]
MKQADIHNLPPEKQALMDECLSRISGGAKNGGFFELECRDCDMPSVNNEEVCPLCGSKNIRVTYRYS